MARLNNIANAMSAQAPSRSETDSRHARRRSRREIERHAQSRVGLRVDSLPKIPLATWNTLSDVAGTTFFSPYGP